MIKKFLLFLGIAGLILFWGNFSLAIDTPSGLNVNCNPRTINDCVLAPWLDWNDVAGAFNYRIQTYRSVAEIDCSTIAEGSWIELDELPAVSTIRLTSLQPDRYYCWRVRAEDVSSQSGWALGPRFHTQVLAPPPNGGNGDGGGPPAELTPPIAAETLEELFTAIINFLFYLVMALAPLMIIWAGFLILTAAGKAEQVNKGKTIILWTLIAVAIVLFAKGLPSVVKGILGG